MTVLIKILGTATELFPDLRWLADYDVEAYNGLGDVTVTSDRAKAKRFTSQTEAFAAWNTQSTVRPLRADGRPNKPLTHFTIEVEDA